MSPATPGQLQQGLPLPQVRLGLRAGVWRHEVADLGPQRHEQFLLEAAIELLELGGHLGLTGLVLGDEGDRRDLHDTTLLGL
jgi:hypothetical protein